jgi:hypothetical protein
VAAVKAAAAKVAVARAVAKVAVARVPAKAAAAKEAALVPVRALVAVAQADLRALKIT